MRQKDKTKHRHKKREDEEEDNQHADCIRFHTDILIKNSEKE